MVSTTSMKRKNASTDQCTYDASNLPSSGPLHIVPSWKPINRAEKPPYSYATIIGHAILSSKERKLTLHDIYIWITQNYPFYSNDTQGWQNSIRHNLSLHKAFVKIDRDPNAQNPPRKGCFWTIRQGKEKMFIDNLQRPSNSARKQYPLTQHHSSRRQYYSSRRSSSALSTASSASSCQSKTSNMTTTESSTTEVCATSSVSFGLPESEPIVVSSSSTSPLLSASSSSSSPVITTEPSYNQLFSNVPESTNVSYNVYPENTSELFGDFYPSMYLPETGQPSCDAYSTTSSLTDNLMPAAYYSPIQNSPDMQAYAFEQPHTVLYDPVHYSSSFNYMENDGNMMADWDMSHHHQQDDCPMMTILKHQGNPYFDSNTDSTLISPTYYQHLQSSHQDTLGPFHR
ncbi:Forkhead protein sep1 [Choanephora cucurbitarum]|uniref:Forkhead protein sep1 n=1 Tax=Choanephora cucurbitarum TaxID=101091 RepID=A0A1C7NKK1_9FUNG|nr:Forkhead protein sep1 [Choanephora cucurbitarum]